MKLIRLTIFVFLFVGSLVVSRNFSLAIFHPDPQNSTISVDSIDPIVSELGEESQLNILVFHTSTIEKPDLIGAWWVALVPNSPITMINLYPNFEGIESTSHQLKANFGFIKDHRGEFQLSQSVLDQLKIKNIPWDGYLVLDDIALQTLIDYLGGVYLNGEAINGLQVISRLNSGIDPDQQKSEIRFEIWKELCQKSLFANSSASFELVRPGLIQHSIVSPDFPITLQDFHKFNITNQSVSCHIVEHKTDESSEVSGTKTSLSEEDR